MPGAVGDGRLRLGRRQPAARRVRSTQESTGRRDVPAARLERVQPCGHSRNLSQRVSEELVKRVKGIDVVNPRKVDEWVDESDWGDFRELAEAVRADMVVHIELDDFDLYKGTDAVPRSRGCDGQRLRHAASTASLYGSHKLGEVLYPVNSGIPAQDKPPQQFEQEFVEVIADQIAVNFYRHDPHDSFAMDAKANR